jgi:secondary thiamine-phosphate synthase enzyme
MKIFQQQITLKSRARGFHLITEEIENALKEITSIKMGFCLVYIQHTSASLTINENADPTVRKDFESHFNKLVPENMPYYLHNDEGSDDMPAHIKAALLGTSLNIPISNGRLALGVWQGIYLCEHRNYADGRNILITVFGE